MALFDFVIKYQTGHSNRAADTLSHHPFNPSCDNSFTDNEANSEEFEVISFASVCEAVDLYLNSTKIPEDLMQEAQNISCAIEPIIEEEDKNEIVSGVNAVFIFEQVTPEKIAEAIGKIKSKAVQKYLLQFDRLTMKKGVLHQLYIHNDVEFHQMILPLKYQAQVLQLLHDGQGHQGIERTIALCWE